MTISLNGKTTYLETYGPEDGPPIVLIHGLGADHGMWHHQARHFASSGYQVIVPDMYGHGESSDLERADLEEWSTQIDGITANLDTRSFILGGVSMGGVIAQHYAATRPDRLIALILSDTFGDLETAKERALGTSQILGFRIFRLLGRRVFASAMRSTYKQSFAWEAGEVIHANSLDADFAQLILARKAINALAVGERLTRFEAPVLSVVGESFGEFFVALNRKLADRFPHATFVTIPESMDPSPLVNPTEFNRAMENFLRGLKPEGSDSQT